MATFGQIIYMVSDLLKESTDDSFYTEEHILFIANKMRSLLLERKYRGSRNQAFKEMPEENKQRICIDLIPADDLDGTCSGSWLRSTEKIPELVNGTVMDIYPVNNLLFTNISYIAPERMPYVGYNRWLKNILYASKASNGYLYLHGNNPQFMLMEKVEAEGVFEDTDKAAALSCGAGDGEGAVCDYMDKTFPLEDALVMNCIELVVQELVGARYSPEDQVNNAKDDFGDNRIAQTRAAMPAERSAYAYRNYNPQAASTRADNNDEAGS